MTSTEADKKLQELLKKLDNKFEESKVLDETETKGGNMGAILSLKNDGQYIGRFLPPQGKMIHPWVHKFNHYFESAATGEIVNFDCPSTINKPCKICLNNKALWKQGDKASQNLARKYGRKDAYFSNMFMKESKNPEDIGQVKVYRFGKGIHEKLQDAKKLLGMFWNPTDVGSDFVLFKKTNKVRFDDGREVPMPNYDSSQFLQKIPLAKTSLEIIQILSSMHDLSVYEYHENEDDPDLSKAFRTHILGKAETSYEAPRQAVSAPKADENEMPSWDKNATTEAPTPSEDHDAEEWVKQLEAQMAAGN
jgi:hypothetical protein